MAKALYSVVIVRSEKMSDFNRYWNSREKTDTPPPAGISNTVQVKAGNGDDAADIAEKQNPGWTAVRSLTDRLG